MSLPSPYAPPRRRLHHAAVGVAVAWATVATQAGCRAVPPGRTAVDAVSIDGARAIDEASLEQRIATVESPRFVGLFRGFVYDYALFDPFVLQRDLARLEAFYRTKGYFQARALAGRIVRVGAEHVRVEIVVEEGLPARVRRVTVRGVEAVPSDVADAARGAATALLKTGIPFEEETFDAAVRQTRRSLTARGFAYAKVDGDVRVDVVHRTADVTILAAPGPRCTFGRVTIAGLGTLPERQVRAAIDIAAGAPYSTDALDAARRSLLDLDVFSAVRIEPVLEEPPPEDGVVPIAVTLEPSSLRTVRLGGGFELGAIKTDVHGVLGWHDRNFFGGLRSFFVELRPGVVLYPIRVDNLVAPEHLLPEARLDLGLRQPGVLGHRTDFFLRPSLDVMPLLLDPDPLPDAPVLGYGELRTAAGLDHTFHALEASLAYDLHYAHPFAYLGEQDPTLRPILLSYAEIVTELDLRDDKQRPTRGAWLGNTLQIAGGPFAGQADDVKIQPEARGYVALGRRTIFAARVTMGALFARNYGTVVEHPDPSAPPSVARTRDYQLTYFRGFFSGGPTSNRGYPVRGISPHVIVPFLLPTGATAPGACTEADDRCRSPIGGFSLWEASVEVRHDLGDPASIVAFCDASDVSPRELSFRLDHPHLSCGAGARYQTPAGPIRLDIGYRIPGLQVVGGLTSDEEAPPTPFFGIPIALHIGIGEAF